MTQQVDASPRRLEDIHESERAKWDQVAAAEAAEAARLRGYEDFEDYAGKNPRLAGAAEFLGPLRGKRVLECGCGLGQLTALLARSGAEVFAFDLSPKSIEVARRRLEANNLDATLAVAAGEELPYEDEAFDIVLGIAVLHHLDVDRARPELQRVLRPGGRAVFAEPMGMNPVLNFARDHLPYREKTPRGADCPLTYRDIEAWGTGFSEFHYREVQLVGMLERLLGHGRHIPFLHSLDSGLLRRFPRLRRYCRYVVIYVTK